MSSLSLPWQHGRWQQGWYIRGTLKKQFTKPTPQLILGRSMVYKRQVVLCQNSGIISMFICLLICLCVQGVFKVLINHNACTLLNSLYLTTNTFSGGSHPWSAPVDRHRADAAAGVRSVRPQVALRLVQEVLRQLWRHQVRPYRPRHG